ncbi:MAG: glycoside hydrolase family 172 protein [Verrucomicrobiota bacterium]
MKTKFLKILMATLVASAAFGADGETRDVSWFLKRLRTVDHLPVLEDSHTAMVSTWDKTGANMDVWTHDNITGKTNTIVDIDGPGCMHRIFTGFVDDRFDHSIIQIFLDGSATPIIDMPMPEFFNDESGPFPYPLTFIKTYPGTLMPIPFEKNITVKIVNDLYETDEWIRGMWGVYWQFTYTKYADDVKVHSLEWPLNADGQAELEKTCAAWLKAESTPPATPEEWTVHKSNPLNPGEALELNLENAGAIEQMRISAWPDTPEMLNKLRLQMIWDGHNTPSVDVPVGYLFGHGNTGHNRDHASVGAVTGKRPVSGKEFLQSEPQGYNSNYNSLLLGMTDAETYCMFPMPFSDGAKIRLVNTGDAVAEQVGLKLAVKKMESIPSDWGRFHVTWSQSLGATEASPKFGAQDIACKIFLNRRGKGKYVGTMLQVDWPNELWWGEGDWLFWTDEVEWPPSYHGTGSEEYFNSGWGMFDRKAISGFVSLRPGFPTVYSFHLNDAFNFQENIIVAEEQWAFATPDATTNAVTEINPMWSSTAFWYADKPMGAESMQ